MRGLTNFFTRPRSVWPESTPPAPAPRLDNSLAIPPHRMNAQQLIEASQKAAGPSPALRQRQVRLERSLAMPPRRMNGLQQFEADQRIAKARIDVRQGLQELRSLVVRDYEKGNGKTLATQELIVPLDQALLKIAAKTESAQNPQLRLRVFENIAEFGAAIKDGSFQEGRATFLTSQAAAHVVAVDVKRVGNRTSVLIAEPVKTPMQMDVLRYGTAAQVNAELPDDTRVTVLMHEAQIAKNGCHIFALSAAAKMADQQNFLGPLHEENAARQSEPEPIHVPYQQVRLARQRGETLAPVSPPVIQPRTTKLVSPDGLERDVPIQFNVGNLRVVDADVILPGAFKKHAQSATALKPYVDQRADLQHQPVNKKTKRCSSA